MKSKLSKLLAEMKELVELMGRANLKAAFLIYKSKAEPLSAKISYEIDADVFASETLIAEALQYSEENFAFANVVNKSVSLSCEMLENALDNLNNNDRSKAMRWTFFKRSCATHRDRLIKLTNSIDISYNAPLKDRVASLIEECDYVSKELLIV